MEKWIKIHDTNYSVSNIGNVKSNKTGKLLTPYISNGYYKYDLYSQSKRRKVYAHQLVCENFKSYKKFNGAQINHIDGNRLNNKIDNLEWITAKGNINHFLYELNKGNKRPVIQMDANGIEIMKWKSIMAANNSLGKRGSGIFNCCNSINKTAYGYKWKYA